MSERSNGSFPADLSPDVSGNLLVQGDNLLALKALLPYYAGQVKCIYIDPPYNTGNENWVYNDNVNSPEIRKWLGRVVAKEAEDLSRHDKWLCMMYPRLALLREFLRDDGAIFISIDDTEVQNLRGIMDEIFGQRNFIATVIWQKVYSPKSSAKHFSEDHDYIVVYSRTMKSPAMELALKPLRQRQSKAIKQYAEAIEGYKTEAMRYELDLADWKKSGGKGLPPTEPEPQVLSRCWCDDTTIEALAVLLLQNWRGLLMVRDELAGWLGGFDRYAQGKGSDVAKWLEMHGGRSIMVDRKTGQPRTIYVPRAAVSVTGSIQPATLQRSLGRAYFENGLVARLLLANPPRRVKRWTEAEIDPAIEQVIAEVFDRLFDLEPVEGPDGDPEPGIVRLSPSAKAAWVRFYNEHAEEQVDLSGDLSAAWSKLEGYAARLALVVHLVRWASGDLSALGEVDEQSIITGIDLSRWFGQETQRVYDILNESEEDRDRRELIERIRRKGGKLTARDLQRSSRAYPDSETAEATLDGLVKAGFGHWEQVHANGKGGRPTRRFVLADSADVDKTPQTLRN